MSLQSNDANVANGSNSSGSSGPGKGPIIMTSANANRRKRTSSLMQAAAALQSVESSLEDFISRANSTGDTGHAGESTSWKITGDMAAREAKAAEIAHIEAEAEQRRQTDAVRWRQAEVQLRSEAEAKENALRKQVDVLQNRLAASEARVAIAADGESNGAAAVAAMAQLQAQLAKAEERARSTDTALQIAQNKVNELATPTPVAATAISDSQSRAMMEAAEHRAKIADVRATKALAAARAATAGLTVSHDDLEAIASGLNTDLDSRLPVTPKAPWLKIGGAFAGGLAAMFAVGKLMAGNPAPAPANLAPVMATAPAAVPVSPAPPPAPLVEPQVTAAAPTAAPVPAPDIKAVAPTTATVEPIAVPSVEPIAQEAKLATKRPAPSARPRPAAKASSGMTDPFADPKAAPKTAAKTKIVDPF
jgi:hypothetical protein